MPPTLEIVRPSLNDELWCGAADLASGRASSCGSPRTVVVTGRDRQSRVARGEDAVA